MANLRARLGTFTGLVAILSALAGLSPAARAGGLTYQTLNDNADPTFNQLLSINNSGTIAGYFGMGPPGNPNKGYTLAPPYGQTNYTNENFPGSFQTQVTGINNSGQTVGFYADAAGDNFGWVNKGGTFTKVVDPNSATGVGNVFDQVLGVNDKNQAVGFYLDANGTTHGFRYDINTKAYATIDIAGATSVTATDINNSGLISGFYTAADGSTRAFLEYANGTGLQTFQVAGSMATQFFGLNNNGQEVGSYIDANGVMHGLLFTTATQAVTNLDDPNGIGTTTINGINDKGQAVGFYVDGNDNTDGVLVSGIVPEPGSVTLMGIGLAAALGYVHRRRSKDRAAAGRGRGPGRS